MINRLSRCLFCGQVLGVLTGQINLRQRVCLLFWAVTIARHNQKQLSTRKKNFNAGLPESHVPITSQG